MKRKTLSEVLTDSAKELGFDKITVDKLEALNIPEAKQFSADEIRKIREKVNASQGVFAAILNVAPSTIQKWEQGVVRPQNAALRLLNIISSKGLEALT